MKKNLFLFLTLVCCLNQFAFAQEISVIGGMNLSKINVKDEGGYSYSGGLAEKSRIGGHTGLLLGIDLKENMFIETGLMFNTAGMRYKLKEDEVKYVSKIKLSYLNVPITFKYAHSFNEKFRIYGLTGPSIGIAVAGKYTELAKLDGDKEKEKESIDFGSDDYDDFKRLDVGWIFGTGFDINKIRIGVFYNLGITNIAANNDAEYKARNRNFGISLGYYLKK